MTTPVDQHVLVPGGPQAAHIAELWWLYLAVMVAVCVAIWGCTLVALLRRDTRLADPALDEDTLAGIPAPERKLRPLSAKGEARLLRWVVGASVVSIAVLFVLLARSMITAQRLAQLPDRATVRIELTGHRWWWELRYIERDVSQGFTTANEIHIPVGRTVELKLRSADVIHSFWVPNLHGKRDLIPGHDTTLLLQADRPSAFRGQCAEFCGTAHALMALWVVAEPEPAYRAWKAAQRATPAAPASDEAKRGKALFEAGPCAMCHTVAGTSAQSSVGPDLTHVASRRSLAAGTLANTRGHLAGWLANAPNLKPGTAMPSISLESHQLHALVAYMESLR